MRLGTVTGLVRLVLVPVSLVAVSPVAATHPAAPVSPTVARILVVRRSPGSGATSPA
jgi:hypothetical protein